MDFSNDTGYDEEMVTLISFITSIIKQPAGRKKSFAVF